MNNNFGLKYYSSGSYGVLVKNLTNDFIYKITEFSNYNYINCNNFNEMIYLNYFKNKYPNLYEKNNNNLPIQNISTHINTFDHFIKQYEIDEDLINKIKNKLQIELIDLIIINKMKFYQLNLNELKKKDMDIDDLYIGIEKIILGLHFFHFNGFAHGDLKPSNIVSNKNNYKIIDFGGIKHINNPDYECTCTCTYRSPEDYNFEHNSKNDKTLLYSDCPLKSDIWSLGLVFNEFIDKSNPIQIIYNQFKNYNYNKNINLSQNDIEYKIYLYFKKIKKLNNTSLLLNDSTKINNLYIYKINKIIEQMLNLNPNERLCLNHVYLNLFYQELPDLNKYKIICNYSIKSKDYFDKFIRFRKYYYNFIKLNLNDIGELFLYPFIINLFDRFLIKIINNYLIEQSNFNSKLSFIIDIINSYDDYNANIFNVNLCYFAIYLISKLVVLKKNIDVVKNILNLNYHLNIDLNLEKEKITIDKIKLIYEFIVNIIDILNYDVVRTKLFFYHNTAKELVDKLIILTDEFDISKIITHIE